MPDAKDPGARLQQTRQMPLPTSLAAMTDQANAAAAQASATARIRVGDESALTGLAETEALFNSVWGLPHGETAIPAELLRSISHAGCNVTVARDDDGLLVGAAVAIVSPQNSSMYSLIAGVLPGVADTGIGFALKQHQRAWGLARGLTTMTWTFDPLVSRNARFNLTKLGAYAAEYAQDFYGPMHGAINANDESDRLIAVWPLDSGTAVRASEGHPQPVDLIVTGDADAVSVPKGAIAVGPDGLPCVIDADGSLWCRVPVDIVALRSTNPEQAAAWRRSVRRTFTEAFASGHTARGVTRTGWYRLVPKEQQ